MTTNSKALLYYEVTLLIAGRTSAVNQINHRSVVYKALQYYEPSYKLKALADIQRCNLEILVLHKDLKLRNAYSGFHFCKCLMFIVFLRKVCLKLHL